jgi:oxygen-independent coproporphyrinogen III oxidase
MTALDSVDRRLTERYGTEAFMYVEYPHKRFWRKQPDQQLFINEMERVFTETPSTPLMLYVHIPFCHKQCLFCTCHVEIELNYAAVKNYLEYLYREIDLLKDFFDAHGVRPNFREIHLGGGSPTYPKPAEFDQLVEKLSQIVDMHELDEFAIEIDPRRVKLDRMLYYKQKGINRISFGIQDFDPEVQKAVNRVQPANLTERLLTPEVREMFANGVNFDILCGLPHQTRETFRSTMHEVVRLSPDRICVNYMHMSPQFNPHQLDMPADTIPDQFTKKEMFLEAVEILISGGYLRTGYDHFAKADDPVAKAMLAGEMQWNRLGVTTGRYTSTIALGVSGTGTLGDGFYYQNVYDIPNYQAAIDRNEFPIGLAHRLDDTDRLRRDLIQDLRSYFKADKKKYENRTGDSFDDYFATEITNLGDFVENGLVKVDSDRVEITEIGQQFANLIASTFDTYIRD